MMENAVDFLTASLLTAYPDDRFIGFVKEVMNDETLSMKDSLKTQLAPFLESENALDDLRSTYIQLFDRGSGSASLYETEYGRDRALGKGIELADLSGFYKAFGLDFGGPEGAREMRDHISVEFEFYSLLLMKEQTLKNLEDLTGVEIVRDARAKFMKDHLGRFAGSVAEQTAVKENSVYSEVFTWCKNLVEAECKQLGVDVSPVKWVPGQQAEDSMSCGGTGCVLPTGQAPTH